jgi:hypothetical protein
MDFSSYAILLLYSSQWLLTRRVDRDRRLAHFSRRRGARDNDLFSGGRLQEQTAWAEAAELRATANSSCLNSSHALHSKYE